MAIDQTKVDGMPLDNVRTLTVGPEGTFSTVQILRGDRCVYTYVSCICMYACMYVFYIHTHIKEYKRVSERARTLKKERGMQRSVGEGVWSGWDGDATTAAVIPLYLRDFPALLTCTTCFTYLLTRFTCFYCTCTCVYRRRRSRRVIPVCGDNARHTPVLSHEVYRRPNMPSLSCGLASEY